MAKIGSAIAPSPRMMALGATPLSDDDAPMKWEEDCAAISRQKARRRARAGWKRRLMLLAMVMIPAYLALGGWWLWKQHEAQAFSNSIVQWVVGLTANAGFTIERVELKGLENLKPQWVLDAADIQIGAPIFSASVKDIWHGVKALPEVRDVKIERDLPDTLRLTITEREAAAVWQHEGRQQWIDRDGTVLANQRRRATTDDLVLVGEDALRHAEAFLAMLSSTPELEAGIASASRVGKRRWDVAFKNGLVLKLPADNMRRAWKKFATLVEHEKLMDRDVKMVDLRIEDRVFLALNPQEQTASLPLNFNAESPE